MLKRENDAVALAVEFILLLVEYISVSDTKIRHLAIVWGGLPKRTSCGVKLATYKSSLRPELDDMVNT